GHIFFSLSIAFAIMITYSSYLPKRADITNNAFITGFANSSFELLAGIGVFAILGFMAAQSNVAVADVATAGVGLAFVVFPQIINQFPGFNGLFGFLFFFSLTLAGLTSLMSITETYVAGISEKFGISRAKAVAFGGGLAALISILFATQGGLFFLDIADYYINQFGVAAVGLVEVIMVVWILRKADNLRDHANNISDIHLGAWWKFSLGIITPLVLGYMMFGLIKMNLLQEFDTDTGNYEGYSNMFTLAGGVAVAGGALLIGILFTLGKWHKDHASFDEEK
ncbi:MAG TPA: sodium-dependent transporter, partial [Planococcus sp. (in: firmicutes)]|nr:sodium-dependent transporter [Planococcus sp. (in: firmicutes)]